MNNWDVFWQLRFKHRKEILWSTNTYARNRDVKETIVSVQYGSVLHKHFYLITHCGSFFLPVRQYAFVSAANTPISLEFSNDVRVAMIVISVLVDLMMIAAQGGFERTIDCSRGPKEVSWSTTWLFPYYFQFFNEWLSSHRSFQKHG